MTYLTQMLLPWAVILMAQVASAVELSSAWVGSTRGYQHEVILVCGRGAGDERLCQETCGEPDRCVMTEGYCRNCEGTASALLRDFFMGVGTSYRASDEMATLTEIRDLLRSGYFVALEATSPFNFYRNLSEPAYRDGFAALCGSDEGAATVLVALNAERSPVAVPYVACGMSGVETKFKRMKVEKPLLTSQEP